MIFKGMGYFHNESVGMCVWGGYIGIVQIDGEEAEDSNPL